MAALPNIRADIVGVWGGGLEGVVVWGVVVVVVGWLVGWLVGWF